MYRKNGAYYPDDEDLGLDSERVNHSLLEDLKDNLKSILEDVEGELTKYHHYNYIYEDLIERLKETLDEFDNSWERRAQ